MKNNEFLDRHYLDSPMHLNFKKITKTKLTTSKKKEIARYAVSFFFAWLISALISDFPFFKKVFIQSIHLDEGFNSFMVFITEFLLNLLGLQTYTEGNFLKIIGTPGVSFSYGCLGFRELAFFIVFVVFQFGQAKHKLWYIPVGVTLLIVLNIIRIFIIILGQYRNPEQFKIIHDIVSPVIMYPTILFLWLYWLKTYGKQTHDK